MKNLIILTGTLLSVMFGFKSYAQELQGNAPFETNVQATPSGVNPNGWPSTVNLFYSPSGSQPLRVYMPTVGNCSSAQYNSTLLTCTYSGDYAYINYVVPAAASGVSNAVIRFYFIDNYGNQIYYPLFVNVWPE